ncbi:hypothetical protein PtA15_12A163 [Puccinia triticina]|uniref:Uncharacterized protein n=1 Tax=Puccinia triticina TaxID=208348 RepID=A0ABY7D5H5_9BASI|nr:uncharacterized protein PtA15_12A163 [Puccinia triticina]WAQ90177.1 hypothetical protein PtA15_12A163 [Puccinia triticina]
MILLSSLTGTNVRGGMGAIVSKPAASSARCPVYYMIGYALASDYVKNQNQIAHKGHLLFISARGTGEGPNGSIGYASLYEKAMVQVQALNYKEIPRGKIIAVVLFGNPYFRAGAPQNKCGGDTGMGNMSKSGVKMPDQLADRVFDCCAPRDEVCQSFFFFFFFVRIISNGSRQPHHSYVGKHEDDATGFVIQKLRAKLYGATPRQKRIS